MSALSMLRHAATVVADRGRAYGDARQSMEAIASLTLGHPVTAAEVALCMIDLKLQRLSHDPSHEDSLLDVAGYAAVLHEVTR
jgi:Domain of unknown function (DUF6378)